MSNTNYKLTEKYPLSTEHDPSHDLSKGLRRHFPLRRQMYLLSNPPRDMPLVVAVVIVAGALMVARVL